MTKRLKLKRKPKIITFIFVLLIIGSIIGVNKYKEYKYHQTYEYKLQEHGYTYEETKKLIDNFNDEKLTELLNTDKNVNLLKLLDEKYYISNNVSRYEDYLKSNSKVTINQAVTMVNVNRDKKYYEDIIETDTTKDTLILVNKYYKLNDSYNPTDTVTISTNYSWGTLGSKTTRKVTYDAFINMWQAANTEANIWLMVNSAYRDYQSQSEVYDNFLDLKGEKYADSIAARPGSSEHETGLALDIFTKTNSNKNTFKDSEAYKWLKDNSYRFGFILRYPEDKEEITGYSFESWHYRYVGTEIAKYIYDNNITFDEYYAYYLNN